MIHGALNVAIFATRRKMPCKAECQHIAEVTTMLRYFLVDIAAKHFRFVGERTGAEGMLGVEGKGDILQLIRGCEIPCGCLMSPMLTLHEVPTIIRVCSQRPSAKIDFHAGTTVECCIGMAIVIREVEETVDASIEGDTAIIAARRGKNNNLFIPLLFLIAKV